MEALGRMITPNRSLVHQAMAFLYQDQLQFGMEMKGGIEGVFIPVDDGQPAVVQEGDLGFYDSHMAIMYPPLAGGKR